MARVQSFTACVRYIVLLLFVYVHRPGDGLRQQQAAQPYVHVPITLTYGDRPPPPALSLSSSAAAAANDQHGERWMSLEPSSFQSVTAAYDVPPGAGEQHPYLPSWQTGRVMPAQSSVSSIPFMKTETIVSTATTTAPSHTSSVEERSPGLPQQAVEDWRQYGSWYDPASSEVPRYMTSDYDPQSYDNRVVVDDNLADSEQSRPAGSDVSSGMTQPARGTSSSALRQPATTPSSGKKTVTFHENIATEYAIRPSYGSTSSDSSFVLPSPPDMSTGYDSVMYQGAVYSYGSSVPH